jgi:hypothetical protein
VVESLVSRLPDFLNLAVFDTRCASAKTLVRSVDNSAYGLNIHIPAPVGHIVGVTDLMPELRTLAA